MKTELVLNPSEPTKRGNPMAHWTEGKVFETALQISTELVKSGRYVNLGADRLTEELDKIFAHLKKMNDAVK
jgi:hypothetical protein